MAGNMLFSSTINHRQIIDGFINHNVGQNHYPLVIQHSFGKWQFIVNFPQKNVIFHSYVSLPEGIDFDIPIIYTI